MSYRADISVDWSLSPRIITVASPSTELTMQDCYDTLRVLEASTAAMDEPPIVSAGGKENLGGGVKVGLTVTLLNAKVAFEARSGPTYIQCNISGGNLVAIDDVGSDISPIEPTAFTQIVLANSSSATLQEQTALQYASFNGGVTVDTQSPYSGTQYPTGTPQEPVNNLTDAMLIATERGFGTLFILGDITVDSGGDYRDMIFIGESQTKSQLTISSDAQVLNAEFYDATVTGVLDGNAKLKSCLIGSLTFVSGFIEQCVLAPGTIELGGSTEAHFLDCWSGEPGTGTPTLDLGGSGQALALRNYNGGIKLINKTGTESVSIDLNSGQVIIDDTVISGTVVLRGVGKWTNQETYTGGANVLNELVEGHRLQDVHAAHFNRRYWDKDGDTITIYDTDNITPLYVFDTNDDMSNITPQ